VERCNGFGGLIARMMRLRYNASGARAPGTSSLDLDHAFMTRPGLNSAAYENATDSVKLK